LENFLLERIKTLLTGFHEQEISHFITFFPSHLRYLTGFTGSNGCLIISQDEVYFLTDRRYRDQSRQELRDIPIILSDIGKSLVDTLAENKLLPPSSSVGFESDRTSYKTYRSLCDTFSDCAFVPKENFIESRTMIKDAGEIENIRRAVAVTERVFEETLKTIRPGISENELAARISLGIRIWGGEKESFETIVASGPRSALPHARPSDRELRRDEFVLFDFGAVVGGYHADMTRTVFLGKPSDVQKNVYRIVLESLDRASRALRPGIRAAALDSVARNFIALQGYGDYFSHALGHGLGLDVHQAPFLSHTSPHDLQAGNVIAIEPGIYLPDQFGVRIENDFLVTASGSENLMTLPCALICL
jgi:Xaa-Pro aminopeptidase